MFHEMFKNGTPYLQSILVMSQVMTNDYYYY